MQGNTTKSVYLEEIADVIDPQPDHRAPKLVENGFSYVGIGDIDRDETVKLSTINVEQSLSRL